MIGEDVCRYLIKERGWKAENVERLRASGFVGYELVMLLSKRDALEGELSMLDDRIEDYERVIGLEATNG